MCSMNGSQSAPSSATTNGTCCAISPEINATSRDSRSSFATSTAALTGSGHKLFELTCAHDLEGVVAKRLKDGYGSRVRWLKIKNPGYSQNEGRRGLFDRSPSGGG